MEEYTIRFPAQIRRNKDGYSQLIKTIEPVFNKPNNTCFIFDFAQIKWLDANLLAVIGAAVEHRKDSCDFRYIEGSINQRQADLWGRNGFGNYFNLKVQKRYDTTVDYKVFDSDEAKGFGEYIDDHLLSKEGFPRLSLALKKRISNNIQEIFGNAPLHGNCNNVISCGQYFYKAKELAFTIVDCGSTITENVVEYFMYLQQSAPKHCIEWATIENNSTKEIINGKSGGMGLSLLKEFIGLNNGRIQICSGNEFWEYKQGKEISTHIDSNFSGTIVSININMNDNHSYLLRNESHDINDLF